MANSITLSLADIPPRFQSHGQFRYPSARIPHVFLEPASLAGKRVFVVGDVHGCYNELRELIDKAGVGTNNPNVVTILVGDLINKGPKNREVLDYIRRLGALSVRGNHDQKCVNQMTMLRQGKPIREQEFSWLRSLTDVDYAQLMDLPYTISLPSLQSVVVHAGLVPGIPLHSQDIEDMMLMRNLVEVNNQVARGENWARGTGYRATKSRSPGDPWASLWPGPHHVYFGHDALRGLQQHTYATGLDTGCVYGRSLTGVFLTGDKQLVKVDAKEMYCKPDGVP